MLIEQHTKNSEAKIVKKALVVLKNKGVIMHATETCYGFAVDALDKKAILRLYSLKKMDLKKPSSIMVFNLKSSEKYGKFNTLSRALAKKYLPGPLTIIVPRKASLPSFLNPASKTIGIRIPAHNLTLKILKTYKKPLITTSANISGQKEVYSAAAFLKSMPKNASVPDLIIDSGAIPIKKPSTVVIVEKNKIKTLRQGNLVIPPRV